MEKMNFTNPGLAQSGFEERGPALSSPGFSHSNIFCKREGRNAWSTVEAFHIRHYSPVLSRCLAGPVGVPLTTPQCSQAQKEGKFPTIQADGATTATTTSFMKVCQRVPRAITNQSSVRQAITWYCGLNTRTRRRTSWLTCACAVVGRGKVFSWRYRRMRACESTWEMQQWVGNRARPTPRKYAFDVTNVGQRSSLWPCDCRGSRDKILQPRKCSESRGNISSRVRAPFSLCTFGLQQMHWTTYQ